MAEEKILCCDGCLPRLIAQDERTKTVRALGYYEDVKTKCRCGDEAHFELSR